MSTPQNIWNQNVDSFTFNSPTYGTLSLHEVITQIKMFLTKFRESECSLVIGSDSNEKIQNGSKEKYAHVITAIIVYRKGSGGIYFWHKNPAVTVHSLREKIYAETFTSLHFATAFVPYLKKALNGQLPKYNLEIHIDVGNRGETREMIKEVVGIISGNGFVAKTKPESYGASYIADKHT